MTTAPQLALFAASPLADGRCAECGGRVALGLHRPTCSAWPGSAAREHADGEVCGCPAPHEGACPRTAGAGR